MRYTVYCATEYGIRFVARFSDMKYAIAEVAEQRRCGIRAWISEEVA